VAFEREGIAAISWSALHCPDCLFNGSVTLKDRAFHVMFDEIKLEVLVTVQRG
jgi:hypothetical protein